MVLLLNFRHFKRKLGNVINFLEYVKILWKNFPLYLEFKLQIFKFGNLFSVVRKLYDKLFIVYLRPWSLI